MSYIVPMNKPVCHNCYFRVGRYCGIIESMEQTPVDPNRCPLVGIPTPHGDLVDRDKLMVDVMDSDIDHLQRDDWKEVIQIVGDAPTIIEAEDT